MKIAQITSVYISVPPKTYGGTERIVHYLCRDLRRRGHDVELFASGDSEVDCTLQSVLPIASQDDSRSTFYLEKEFEARNTWNLYRQSERFDVIHAHWTTIAPYFSNFTMTPTLITYAYIEQEIHEFYKRHFPRCLPVCVSRAQAEMLGDPSIPVVYNGVDLDDIPFGDKPEDFFLIAGRMVPEKGIADAIRIATRVKTKLVIVGHVTSHLPWSEEYFLQEVKPHIDNDKIRYIDRLAHRDLARLMSKAKAFLFPIHWDEPFGMVVIEAMAAGAPVLAYRRGAMTELIENGATGYLVQSEEEMVERIEQLQILDRARCRAWGQEHFSVEKMIDGYERLYHSVLKGSQQINSKSRHAP
jgi:glycosyltransferase involved in cell wall biosynthesis